MNQIFMMLRILFIVLLLTVPHNINVEYLDTYKYNGIRLKTTSGYNMFNMSKDNGIMWYYNSIIIYNKI